MGKEERNIYTIQKDESIGEVKIADEVVASIAAFAAMEVEGVASLGGMTKEIMGKLGMKSPARGVKVEVLEGIVTVTLTMNVLYGYGLVEICSKVQEKVKSAIENMTGLTVADVAAQIIVNKKFQYFSDKLSGRSGILIIYNENVLPAITHINQKEYKFFQVLFLVMIQVTAQIDPDITSEFISSSGSLGCSSLQTFQFCKIFIKRFCITKFKCKEIFLSCKLFRMLYFCIMDDTFDIRLPGQWRS